jgi:leucyl aminopeptidase
MDVILRQGDITARATGAIAVLVFQGGRTLDAATARIDRAIGGAIAGIRRAKDFSGRPNEVTVLYPRGKARRLLIAGVGPLADFTPTRAREACGILARRARELGAGTLSIAVPSMPETSAEAIVQAIAEGAVLGHYRFGAYRTDPPPAPLRRIELVERDAARARSLRASAERGRRWAEATCLARDLAWIPGQDLTPDRLADRAVQIGKDAGAKVTVLGPTQMERLGMGAVLAVGRGSVHPPRFIALEYRPRDAAGAPVVVIGKGVTFDTGGISLKPRENMHKMKYDMSGSAAVLGLFAALPTLEPRFPVIGLVPSAENMPGGRAFKPGDVIRAMDGTTIEVTNTDAEGRLLLADALTYARRYEPAVVVDLATLTGAIAIALGHLAGGLFCGDDELAGELLASSAATGERLWRMPLWDEYRSDLRSDTADFTNSSGAREGGAVVAAAFLKHFARGLKWAHLDIASTAWSPTERPHDPRGPTGFGVRLLLDWLSRRSAVEARVAPAGPRARRASRIRAARA